MDNEHLTVVLGKQPSPNQVAFNAVANQAAKSSGLAPWKIVLICLAIVLLLGSSLFAMNYKKN